MDKDSQYKAHKNAYMLAKAIAIAAEAHSQVLDKVGQPYIKHPLRVMLRFDFANDTHDLSQDFELQIIAVLHDVLEDCPEWTAERLREEGFSERSVTALEFLDHSDDRPYKRYILDMVLAGNTDAIQVKMSDLLDNSDTQRLGDKQLQEKDLNRINKYHWSLNFLKKSLKLINAKEYTKLDELIIQEFPNEKEKLKSLFDNSEKKTKTNRLKH